MCRSRRPRPDPPSPMTAKIWPAATSKSRSRWTTWPSTLMVSPRTSIRAGESITALLEPDPLEDERDRRVGEDDADHRPHHGLADRTSDPAGRASALHAVVTR